jgi:CBS domain-containing protein
MMATISAATPCFIRPVVHRHTSDIPLPVAVTTKKVARDGVYFVSSAWSLRARLVSAACTPLSRVATEDWSKQSKGDGVNKRRLLMVLLIIAGVALIALGIYYWVTPAGSLPSFFPGHLAGSAHKSDDIADDAEAYGDPTHTVSKLDAANRTPVSVRPDDPLQTAVTRMQMDAFSQLPVMTTPYAVKGVISWESIAAQLVKGHAPTGLVREFMVDEWIEVKPTDALLGVISKVRDSDYVFVRAADRQICGIVTAYDLHAEFRELAEHFLLLDEIENHVRGLIRDRFTLAELKEIRRGNGPERPIKRIADLDFGDYIWLLSKPERWARLNLPAVDRDLIIERLEHIRAIRNRVMHFDPRGLDDEDIPLLRGFADYLREKLGRMSKSPGRQPDAGQVDEQAQGRPQTPDGIADVAPTSKAATHAAARTLAGVRLKQLVYMPKIEPKTFMHLSTRGDSYALRDFRGEQPRIMRKVEDCETTDELLKRHSPKHVVDVAGDGVHIEGEDTYWRARITKLNRQYGVG